MMYNRYIPQPDGSYRRSRVPDSSGPRRSDHAQPVPSAQEPRSRENTAENCPPEPSISSDQPKGRPEINHQEPPRRSPPCKPGCRMQSRNIQPRHPTPEPKQEANETSVGNFLRQLLPKDFDTGDLLIVLLLLLMAGDCAEDQNNALLTLALYLFM